MSTSPSIERNEVFELAHRFVTETNENIFLTGKAGTGKTTFLKYLRENCSKNMVVAAPTGVAAINAGGVTLHSLFQLPFQPYVPTKENREALLAKMKFNRNRQQLLRKIELLVIDEISMVRSDTMDAIDAILKSVRREHRLPFGGVQLLCIGDLFQLPPVAQRQEWEILREYYASPFFFESNAIREQMPLLIELNKIYRQKEDDFVALLNKVRTNQMGADEFERLHRRYDPDFRPFSDEKYITLTSHNNQADQINHRELHKLSATTYTYNAEIEGDFPESQYPADGALLLKEGAQVMFLKNDPLRRYFNGKIGRVKSLSNEMITVECDGADVIVSKESWENSRYVLNRDDGKLEQEMLGTFTQFPLRLAWAITIHKSQGLTFEKVMIDAGAAFSSGQVYVALSRCTSLDGIVLLSKIPPAAIYSSESVVKGQQALTHKGSLAQKFEGARQIFTQQLLEGIFSFNDIAAVVGLLAYRVQEHHSKLNKEGVAWMEDFKNQFIKDREVGEKFIRHINAMMRDEPVIEKNAALQKRINDASRHFETKFAAYQQSVLKHPLITEHREAATAINEHLESLAMQLHLVNYYLQYGKEPFSVTTFLRHKLNYITPRLAVTCYASGKAQSSDLPNAELFDALKRWRDMICEESGAPIYMVASQAALKELALYLPQSKKDLIQIAGFGKAKVDKYGDDILDTIQDYCQRHGIESNMASKGISSKKVKTEKPAEEKISTSTVTLHLHKEGKSIAEIAKERNLAQSTIEGHLSAWVQKGEIDINTLVTPEKQALINEALNLHGVASFAALKEHLPKEISFGEIRMVAAKWGQGK